MRRRTFLLAAVLTSCVLGWTTLSHSADTLPTRDPALRHTPIVDVVQRVRAAVVNIHSERTVLGGAAVEEYLALAPSQHRINGMGTGIIIDPRGYIVTNHHVVEEVNSIRIRLADGTVSPARIVARDAENDLALLKIDVNHPLQAVPLGTASDLMVGETVIAIGNAYGYDHTVTTGIVSAIGRDVTLNKEMSYKSLIQTDAAINPGNSGGPLLNIYGELIGVNVAIRAGAQNIGFAIPVDTMIRVAANMLAHRGSGGSHGMTVRDSVQTSRDGSFVRSVIVDRAEMGTPASKAGLQPGDVLVKVGDTSINSTLDLERALLDTSAGDHLPLVYRRGSNDAHAELLLDGIRVAAAPGDAVWRRLGLHLQPISAESVMRSNPQLHGGLYISEVRADSTSAKAGLQRGDILIGLQQWETLNPDSVQWVLNHPDLATFNPIRFFILRSGQVHRGTVTVAD